MVFKPTPMFPVPLRSQSPPDCEHWPGWHSSYSDSILELLCSPTEGLFQSGLTRSTNCSAIVPIRGLLEDREYIHGN